MSPLTSKSFLIVTPLTSKSHPLISNLFPEPDIVMFSTTSKFFVVSLPDIYIYIYIIRNTQIKLILLLFILLISAELKLES